MARTKKTAVKSETPSTAPKTRGIDLQEVEARVTALDKAKRRSYDIFDIEQRVYNLEKNGSTPPAPSTTDIIKRVVGDATAGSATIKYTGKYVVWLVLDSSYINSYRFKINNVNATSKLATGVLTHANVTEGLGYTHIEVELTEDDVFTWDVQYTNRYFIMFNKVEE